MKKTSFLILSLGIAFLIDKIGGKIFSSLIPPLIIGVIFYWYGRVDLKDRILLAFLCGFVLDTIGFFPMGTYTGLLLVLAWAYELLKSFFSNTESRTVMALSISLLLIGFRLLIFPVSSLITGMTL